MTVEEYFQKIINELSDLGRLNTRDKYKFTLSSLNKFTPVIRKNCYNFDYKIE